MENCSQEKLDEMCSSALPFVKTKIFEESLFNSFPIYLADHIKSFRHDGYGNMYYFDAEKSDKVLVSQGSTPISKDFACFRAMDYYKFNMNSFIETIKSLANDMVEMRNTSFIRFLQSFCNKEVKFSTQENDGYYFSREKLFPPENVAKTITTIELNDFEVLSVGKNVDIAVFPGDVWIGGYMSP